MDPKSLAAMVCEIVLKAAFDVVADKIKDRRKNK